MHFRCEHARQRRRRRQSNGQSNEKHTNAPHLKRLTLSAPLLLTGTRSLARSSQSRASLPVDSVRMSGAGDFRFALLPSVCEPIASSTNRLQRSDERTQRRRRRRNRINFATLLNVKLLRTKKSKIRSTSQIRRGRRRILLWLLANTIGRVHERSERVDSIYT